MMRGGNRTLAVMPVFHTVSALCLPVCPLYVLRLVRVKLCCENTTSCGVSVSPGSVGQDAVTRRKHTPYVSV